jgi:hypothetical protein
MAESLLVAASVGREGDRNALRVARVPASRAGITLLDLPETPFAPEIAHASVTFADVRVERSELLAGDGYVEFVKPFRTIEDIHVLAAVVGYVTSVARAYGSERAVVEALLADLAALVLLGAADARDRGVHVALGGALAAVRSHLERVAWDGAPTDARDRWLRDAPLLAVANRARAARLDAAWSPHLAQELAPRTTPDHS